MCLQDTESQVSRTYVAALEDVAYWMGSARETGVSPSGSDIFVSNCYSLQTQLIPLPKAVKDRRRKRSPPRQRNVRRSLIAHRLELTATLSAPIAEIIFT